MTRVGSQGHSKKKPLIHKNESHMFKMQRDLVVVILYGSTE